MSIAKAPGSKFEYRYYEAWRRAGLASASGKVGIKGAQEAELQRIKKRRKVELQSTLAEGLRPKKLRGVIDTYYPIEVANGQLVADDGEPLDDMLNRALDADTRLAEEDDFFAEFLPQRTRYELDELHEWEAMVRGEADYNTVITLSPYSEEYDDGTEEAHKKLIRAGQKPYWRRGMFRVAHARGGKIHIFNYSIDSSSVELMAKAAARKLDYKFEAKSSTGMLGERIRRQINGDSWRFIAPGLVAEADNMLAEKNGGTWRHGYSPVDGVRRAQAFVESQVQIVDSLIGIDEDLAREYSTFEDYCVAFELKLYDCLALLEKRLELGYESVPIANYEAASSGAGSTARSEGKVYDACGVIIGGTQAGQAASATVRTGFESLKRLEHKKISCYACKKEVVVPKKDLDEGKLSCRECGYWLDVCTGKSGFKEGVKKEAEKTVSGFEIIADWFRKEKRQTEIRNFAKKQARIKSGDNASEFDIKRHEKQIHQKLAA